jgi:hypothetical protein
MSPVARIQSKGVSFFLMLFLATLCAIPSVWAEEVKYGTGSWDPDAFGNHRALIRVAEKAAAVWVHIPWRRRDVNPDKKRLIIVDTKTNNRVRFLLGADIQRAYGDLIFQPPTAPGDYYVYYMPYERAPSWGSYPDFIYPGPELLLSSGDRFNFLTWLSKNGLTSDRLAKKAWQSLPKAQCVEIQAIDEFNSFYPMEVIATAAETQDLIARHPDAPFLLFPEDRAFPIKMKDDLPFKWIGIGPGDVFQGQALRGEYYAFQVGVYAARESVKDLEVNFSDLKSSDSIKKIPSSAMNCINVGGVDVRGQKFIKPVGVEKGKVQPLWIGIRVPIEIPASAYKGDVTVSAKGMRSQKINLVLKVLKDELKDAGDSEPSRYSRLRWLDSMIAIDDDPVAPFTPMVVSGRTISCLGRKVTLGEKGLPESLQSFFAPEVTRVIERGREILSRPVEMIVEAKRNEILPWSASGVNFMKKTSGAVAWESKSKAAGLTMDCRAQMEFDGHIEFEVAMTATQTTSVNDIRLEIPVSTDVAKYMMGLGLEGGYRPSQHLWKWDEHKLQDAVWMGDVNAGLQCKLKGENYIDILGNVYSRFKNPDKPFINLPPAWHNDGKGGCMLFETGDHTFLLRAYSGPRTIEAGEKLHFNFSLIITPLKPLDPKKHFTTRYFHNYKPVEEALQVGANTINIHHGYDINPYINYPFLRPKELKDYVQQAHDKSLRLKIYYTVRELSNHAAELWALKSLNGEIYPEGTGGGYPWLQEHFGNDYIPAWYTRRTNCAAIATGGNSRWHNYYLEGLDWLAKNMKIDGIYLDDVDFDRDVMKRIRKVLERNRPGALIDFHSCNHFSERFGWASCANLHLEHFPYMDSLWFGEYFDYGLSPDYWLVEVSGIPFGLMGEMLQDEGNPWRGMIYGSVTRRSLPTQLWKVWDEVGIQNSTMLGYWSPSCPVKTGHDDVLTTVYVNKNTALISIASWAKEAVKCQLKIDWGSLGLDPKKAQLRAPSIEDFQDEAHFKPTDTITVEPGKGWLFILSEQKSQ